MKKHVINIICCLVLACTVSFAWILGGQSSSVNSIMFDYVDDKMMSVASVGVDAEVWFRNEDGYVSPKNFDFESNAIIPHSRIPFKIYFDYQATGNDEQTVSIKLSLVGIKVSDPKILEAMFIGITTDGDVKTTNGQRTLYMCFDQAIPSGEGDDITYRLDLYSSNMLIVPHNDKMELINPWDEGTRSSLDCYFYLDPDIADASYQDMTINIGYFRIE